MRKTLTVLILLTAVAAAASAQVGVGITTAFPPALAAESEPSYGMEPQYTEFLFWGITLRYKPSLLLIDVGVSQWEFGGLLYGYFDLGLCLDLWVFRFALCGGVDVINFSPSLLLQDPSYQDYHAVGFNAKVSLDVKLGDSTVGLSAGIPLDTLVNALRTYPSLGGALHDELRLFTAQVSLNFVYWFGGTGSSRRQ